MARFKASPRDYKVVHEIDDYDLKAFVAVARKFGSGRFGYVVTPNVDHLIRFNDDEGFRRLYADASFILNDSRFTSYFLRVTRRIKLPVCAGSDLTAELLATVVAPGDRIVLIGGTEVQARRLAGRFGLSQLLHHCPPMGFIKDPSAIEACLKFVEDASPFRFCFVAVGSPQQEMLAKQLRERDKARGLALCIGSSINFLTGDEARAPRWIQQAGFEWLFRLCQNPRRLAGRYLIRGPRFFGNLRHARFVLRRDGR